MPKTALHVPYVAEWMAAKLTSSQAAQYPSCVRTFFKKRGDFDAKTVTREELVNYCVAIASTSIGRTCAALDDYFEYLDGQNLIPNHPAYRLAKRVEETLERRNLERQLREGGMPEIEVASFLWRDVALEMALPESRLPTGLESKTRNTLFDALLQRLRTASSSNISDVLDVPVFS